MNRDEEKELIREVLMLAQTLREEMPAIRANMQQIGKTLQGLELLAEEASQK